MNAPSLIGELFALSQNGLHFTKDRYDRERYARLREIGVELGTALRLMDGEPLAALSTQDVGYCTPKVDVRAAIFQQDRVLLVREEFDCGTWSLPGGWADTNESPSEAVLREVLEEAHLVVRVRKLAAVLDRSRHAHWPPMLSRVYKMIFVCEPLMPLPDPRASAAAELFAVTDLPTLSLDRILPEQIQRAFVHFRDPALAADFD